MGFEESVDLIMRARADLARAQGNAVMWTDERRRQFDGRAKQLGDAGTQMVKALRSAAEKSRIVGRLLG